MAFTDVEMAILSQLAYSGATKEVNKKSNPSTAPQKGDRLCDLLTDNEEWLKKKLPSENYKIAIDNLITKTKNADYEVVLVRDDKKGTGFAAFAIRDPYNEVTVACRGTEGFDLFDFDSRKDMIADYGLLGNIEPGQHKEMEDFVDQLEKQGYDGYYFTGHSLGGNLATHGAVTVDDTSKVRGVYTYNSPGFNVDYWKLHGEKLNQLHFCITNYQNEYDYISSSLHLPGENVIIASSVTDGHIGFDDHNMDAFEIDDTGSFVPNKTGQKRVQTYLALGLSYFGEAMSLTGLYIQWKKTLGDNICRDFSAETKEMLISIAKEVENEEWWDITKWDCWYKVEKFFGVLEWDLYCGNVESYNRKLIDINDASVKDIKKIFKKVYKLDSSYSTKINSQGEKFKSKVIGRLQKLRDSIVVT